LITHIGKERVALVKSFDELRVGIVTYVRNCRSCGTAWCRGMLVDLLEPTERYPTHDWIVLPNCSPWDDEDATIGAADVKTRRVYRVIDSEPKATSQEHTSTPKQLERVR
jgi:hypothetical protein